MMSCAPWRGRSSNGARASAAEERPKRHGRRERNGPGQTVMRMRSARNWVRPPGPVATGLRIGLLGGSFNPAHEGHMHVTRVALEYLGLDYVWWLVSPQNPLKPVSEMASFYKRLTQARSLAVHPRIRVSGIESEL